MCNRTFFVFICYILALTACAPSTEAWKNFKSINSTNQNNKIEMLTQPLIVLGDTQEHEIAGLPLLAMSGGIDRKVDVTMRPAFHFLYSRKLFEHIVSTSNQQQRMPILHLGDLLDVSCDSEKERYRTIFKSLKQVNIDIVVAPGNHDGLFQGVVNPNNMEYRLLQGATAWDLACRTHIEGRHTLDPNNVAINHNFISKDIFLNWLCEINLGNDCSSTPQDSVHWLQGEFLKAVSVSREPWDKKDSNPTKSYMLQLIQLPAKDETKRKVFVLIFDTTQTNDKFSWFDALTHRSPGDWGSILPSQIQVAIKLLNNDHLGKDDIVIFAGHHPWEVLNDVSKEALIGLYGIRSKTPAVYISAHTHSGFWARHTLSGKQKLLEINVSSLADWPIAFRQLSIGASNDGSRIRVIAGLPSLLGFSQLSDTYNVDKLAQIDALSKQWQAYCANTQSTADQILIDDEVSNSRKLRSENTGTISWFLQAISNKILGGDYFDGIYQDKLNELASVRRIACHYSKSDMFSPSFRTKFSDALKHEYSNQLSKKAPPNLVDSICKQDRINIGDLEYPCDEIKDFDQKSEGNFCNFAVKQSNLVGDRKYDKPPMIEGRPESECRYASTPYGINLACESGVRQLAWWYALVANAAQNAVSSYSARENNKIVQQFACAAVYSAMEDNNMILKENTPDITNAELAARRPNFYIDTADESIPGD